MKTQREIEVFFETQYQIEHPDDVKNILNFLGVSLSEREQPVKEKGAVNVVLKRRISEHCEQLQKLKDAGMLSIFLEQNKEDIESLKSFLFPSPPTGDNKKGEGNELAKKTF